MAVRNPITSTVMLALLLLRAGAGLGMAECAAEHHDAAAATASHDDHPADSAPPCDHPTPNQPAHTATECALSAGCAATPLQLGEADGLAAGPPIHTAWTTTEVHTIVRTVRPVAPPPKS